MSLISSQLTALERVQQGKGMQNFKYSEVLIQFSHELLATSPRAYNNLAQRFKLPTIRSLQIQTSKQPRFPIGVCDETFEQAEKYCEDFNYPKGEPLVMSVDDTKVFPILLPMYNGVRKEYYLVGAVGDKYIAIPDLETFEHLQKDASIEKAKKIHLWTLGIPLHGVPVIALAVLPIGNKMNGSELAVYLDRILSRLISRGYRVVCTASDGAKVE
jgi:hypothetical protein